MKKHLLLTLLLCAAIPAHAQPIESEPLGPAPYTLKGESDPMAMDGPAVPASGPEAPINRGEAAPATPPPGSDTLYSSDTSPLTKNDAATTAPPAASDIPPYPSQPAPPKAMTEYPNNEVAAPPKDQSAKFEKLQFCTLKVSFGSKCCGTDQKTGEDIKSYLDGNASLLTYTRANWGKEGEYTYCVNVKEHRQRAKVYKELKKRIPSISGSKGPVTLTGEGFEPVGENKRKVPQSN